MDKKRSKYLVLWFTQTGIEDVPLVGGKNASLGEMYQHLTKRGVNIPNGFSITATAYRQFIRYNKLEQEIKDILKDLDTSNIHNLFTKGHKIRDLIRNAKFPEDIEHEIRYSYKKLCRQYGEMTDVAVRSSATAEDLPDASFAGQQETYLNIRGEAALLESCKKCFASLFTNRAISYREDKNFDHFNIALSIGVQKMVRSDLASSGVMFSIDTESGFQDVVFINASYGLGENIVQGAVNPDSYYVFKPTLRLGYKPIISKKVGEKKIKMVYTDKVNKVVKNIAVPAKDRIKYALKDGEILVLAKWACIIEDHYSKKAGHFKPMDMEWAKDGRTGQIFIVQARPETVQSQKDKSVLEHYRLAEEGKLLIEGQSVGEKIGAGKAHIIKDTHNIHLFKQGEVLVTDMTDPDWEPIMKKSSAIVTNRGGRTCHAAIISRELGIPCVVGTNTATEVLKKEKNITVSCAEGSVGKVFKGILKYNIKKTNLKNLPHTKTKIMMNLANPDIAFDTRFIPNDGVGLAREEFIINESIKIHPLALIHFKTLKDKEAKKLIEEMTHNYEDKSQFFIDKLAEGIGTIASSFYPKDVILRLSDFKSNEYANLIGGREFEPQEDNPMIGWRGSSRYYSEKYEPAFALECKAIKKAREVFGLKNLKVMVPFCRTVEEGKKVLQIMAKYGLRKGQNKLEVYVMCEIPSNVILADKFCKIFDGFSIGSNDLTQLTLGLDRDSALIADIANENNEAVKELIRSVIKTAKKYKRKIGICGQAPSDFPDFAAFLVDCGIDSISLNPDTVIKTTLRIAKEEEKLFGKKKKPKIKKKTK